MIVVHMNMGQGSSNNYNQRIINPRDINFNAANTAGQSPSKKANFVNANNQSNGGGNTGQKNNDGNNNQIERINVTIPNPLLMPNASVQIQFQQELVRNVLQRVDDIFHLKQIVDIKNNKLKDKALANND